MTSGVESVMLYTPARSSSVGKTEAEDALNGIRVEAQTNRRVLLWVIATVLLTAVSCLPRHPPHTPQPLGMVAIRGATTQ